MCIFSIITQSAVFVGGEGAVVVYPTIPIWDQYILSYVIGIINEYEFMLQYNNIMIICTS